MRKSYILSGNKDESKNSVNGINEHEISEDGVTNNQKEIVNNN